MKKITVTLLLLVFLLVTLTACGKEATPVSTEPVVVAPDQQETSLPTEAPVVETVEPTQPASAAPGPQQPPPVAPTIDGKELLDSRCASCHSVSKVTGTTATAEEWDAIVTRMIAKGANLTEEEKAILVQYLAENYKK